MKYPNVFIKLWPAKDCDPDMPKLGISWFTRSGCSFSRWAGGGIYLYFFGRQFDFIVADNSDEYAKDFGRCDDGPEWDWSLLPVKIPPKKRNR